MWVKSADFEQLSVVFDFYGPITRVVENLSLKHAVSVSIVNNSVLHVSVLQAKRMHAVELMFTRLHLEVVGAPTRTTTNLSGSVAKRLLDLFDLNL